MTSKIYLDNPYLRELDARIVNKVYKNGKYHLKLNRSIFYPHISDKFPSDQGTINGIKILKIYEENTSIVHLVKEDIRTDKVVLNLDWENRLDTMQQLTGQYLLSAAISRLYNGRSLDSYIGKEVSYIDIDLINLTGIEFEKIELYVNRVISSNFDIRSYYSDFFNLNSIYLRATGEVGLLKICKIERYKDRSRISFLAGHRALKDYQDKFRLVEEISSLLSLKDREILRAIEFLYDKNRQLEEEIVNLKKELGRK